MPRFQITVTRAFKSAVLIDAEDEIAARGLVGQVLDESETDSWTERIEVEQVDDDRDGVDLG